MPAARARESLPERRPSSFKNKLTEWWNAFLTPRSDAESVSDMVEELNRAIEAVFCLDDAKKLTSIVSDWAKHINDKQVEGILRPLLREHDRDRGAAYLRKMLSNFFLSLPDPWQTRASSILSALTR